MLAVSALLATGVLSWSDCLSYTAAWDTLMWFTGRACTTQRTSSLDVHVWIECLLPTFGHLLSGRLAGQGTTFC